MKKLLSTICALGAAVSLTACFGGGDIQELEDFFDIMQSGELENGTIGVSMYGTEFMTIECDGDKAKTTTTMDSVEEVLYEEIKDGKYYVYSQDEENNWYAVESEMPSTDDSGLAPFEASDFSYKGGKWICEETEEGVVVTYTVEFFDNGDVTLKATMDFLGTDFDIMGFKLTNVGSTTVTLPTATYVDLTPAQ